ncbi:Beta-lactamase class A [Streptomyces atratus]|uniref:Beta-lactamase class A n=1 Tax=Streptomyces atratus TaxID=1893 RepID=A0A1K1XE27_STRAR|nr:Beta-lactamase class A [Streptomyces atratus]
MDLDAALAAAVEPLLTDAGGARVSAAALDTGSGARAACGGGSFDTASIVKVDMVAALLLLAQDEQRALTAVEHDRATAVIERSDNASATALLRAVGGPEALDAAHARLGLTGTTAAHAWGLTRTTAADQLALLRAVFGTDSELSEDSRAYLRGLMERVEAGQRWGVSAAGGDWALKNGRMPRTTTGALGHQQHRAGPGRRAHLSAGGALGRAPDEGIGDRAGRGGGEGRGGSARRRAVSGCGGQPRAAAGPRPLPRQSTTARASSTAPRPPAPAASQPAGLLSWRSGVGPVPKYRFR